jgi:hypothetical protein
MPAQAAGGSAFLNSTAAAGHDGFSGSGGAPATGYGMASGSLVLGSYGPTGGFGVLGSSGGGEAGVGGSTGALSGGPARTSRAHHGFSTGGGDGAGGGAAGGGGAGAKTAAGSHSGGGGSSSLFSGSGHPWLPPTARAVAAPGTALGLLGPAPPAAMPAAAGPALFGMVPGGVALGFGGVVPPPPPPPPAYSFMSPAGASPGAGGLIQPLGVAAVGPSPFLLMPLNAITEFQTSFFAPQAPKAGWAQEQSADTAR